MLLSVNPVIKIKLIVRISPSEDKRTRIYKEPSISMARRPSVQTYSEQTKKQIHNASLKNTQH